MKYIILTILVLGLCGAVEAKSDIDISLEADFLIGIDTTVDPGKIGVCSSGVRNEITNLPVWLTERHIVDTCIPEDPMMYIDPPVDTIFIYCCTVFVDKACTVWLPTDGKLWEEAIQFHHETLLWPRRR